MSNLQSRIEDDLRAALREKDHTKLEVLRLFKSDLQYEMSKTGQKLLEDYALSKLLKSAVKKRKESIRQFQKAGRTELIAKEKRELSILEQYLPPALSFADMNVALDPIFAKIQPASIKDLGKIMGAAMSYFQSKGDNIDPAELRRLIQKRLETKA